MIFLKKLDKKEIYMWKPSINFWIMLCCSLMIWLLLGPIWWRHVDDFGPIQFFINKETFYYCFLNIKLK